MQSYITLILEKLPGETPKQKFEALELCLFPDGNINYEGAILINCLRLLDRQAMGRLVRNLIERGADYTPMPVVDGSTEAP